jgi:hypothetical protein
VLVADTVVAVDVVEAVDVVGPKQTELLEFVIDCSFGMHVA